MRSQVESLFIERSLTKYLFLRAFGYQSITFDGCIQVILKDAKLKYVVWNLWDYLCHVTNGQYEYIINVSWVPFLKVLRIVLEAY